jgi:hypothetical protein
MTSLSKAKVRKRPINLDPPVKKILIFLRGKGLLVSLKDRYV